MKSSAAHVQVSGVQAEGACAMVRSFRTGTQTQDFIPGSGYTISLEMRKT